MLSLYFVFVYRQVYNRFGEVTSFTGTYRADEWSLELSSPQGHSSPTCLSKVSSSWEYNCITKKAMQAHLFRILANFRRKSVIISFKFHNISLYLAKRSVLTKQELYLALSQSSPQTNGSWPWPNEIRIQ